MGGYNRKELGGSGVTRSASDTLEGKWGVQADQTQEMKGKEVSGDLEGHEAKSGVASSGRGLNTSGEKGFFADALSLPPAIYSTVANLA